MFFILFFILERIAIVNILLTEWYGMKTDVYLEASE